jgi:hypothetical protein
VVIEGTNKKKYQECVEAAKNIKANQRIERKVKSLKEKEDA